jgi:hypothetical protein
MFLVYPQNPFFDSNYVFMTQPFSDTQTKRAENISLNCLSVNHLQAFLGGRMRGSVRSLLEV